MRLIISEQDKQNILDKYRDNTDDNLFNKLKRRYPIIPKHTKETPLGSFEIDTSIVYDYGDRVAEIKNRKSELVDKIYNEIIDDLYEGKPLDREKIGVIRRTIKRYLDSAPFIETSK
jgi:hypothetical protein